MSEVTLETLLQGLDEVKRRLDKIEDARGISSSAPGLSCPDCEIDITRTIDRFDCETCQVSYCGCCIDAHMADGHGVRG